MQDVIVLSGCAPYPIKDNVVQTTGTGNKVHVSHPKESFRGTLWQKVKGYWKRLGG